MGISGVCSFPVWSGGLLIFFPVPRCRNLALNRVFPTFLSGRHVFYTVGGGCLDAPTFLHPLYIHTLPCTFVHPQGCTPPHMFPLCASVCFQRLLHVVGGCKRLHYVLGHFPYTTSVWGCSLQLHPPHLVVGFPVHQYVLEISICHMGIFPFCWAFGGVPHQLGVLGCTSALMMPICSFLYIFVMHYVSHFSYSYNYYSSGYGGIFWPLISLIHDSGSSHHRVSSKLGSAWSASTTTLDAKRLWRCYWLSFCATAANSIFDASSGLCQLCYGFSTGRFLFQS